MTVTEREVEHSFILQAISTLFITQQSMLRVVREYSLEHKICICLVQVHSVSIFNIFLFESVDSLAREGRL